MLRSCGFNLDLRKETPYEIYNLTPFFTPLGRSGDCLDRFFVRIYEIFYSLNIIKYCSDYVLSQKYEETSSNKKINNYNFISEPFEYKMENMISHFIQNSEGLPIKGENYFSTECPKGEFGIYFRGFSSRYVQRFRLRSPGFFHLQALRFLSQGQQLSDLVTILGSIDLVLGEVDR